MVDKKTSELTNYTPALDADLFPIVDTANSTTKKITWANIKATLKTYFDTLYQVVLGLTSNVSGTGFTLTGGATPKTLTVPLDASVSGTNTGDQTLPTRNSLDLDTDDSPQFAAINLGHASENTLTASGGVLSIETVVIPTISSTNTLTNKRITSRVTSITSHATPTINTDNCDAFDITALAEAITSMTTNLSGTPTNFQKLIVRIKDNGTARAIAWGTSFVAGGVALPTTTVLSKILTVGFIYNTANSLNKWMCVASSQEV